MYNITELDSMDDATLVGIAESMGIKKINIEKRQEVIFNILDQQAIDKAAADAAKPLKKRRGRPARNAEAEKPAEAAPVAETPAPEAPVEQPKKRGRKKKSEVAAVEAPVAEPAVSDVLPKVLSLRNP